MKLHFRKIVGFQTYKKFKYSTIFVFARKWKICNKNSNMIKFKKKDYNMFTVNGVIRLDKKDSFSNRIDAKNSLEYRYHELTRLYKNLTKEILNKNNIQEENDYLFNALNKIMVLYPEKKAVIEEVRNMYYSEMLLTENSLNRLIQLYQEMHKII